jgi:hypothetical protein
LIAAQMASVSTSTISSTYFLAEAEGFLADVLDRSAVGEQADLVERTRLPALSERVMASASTASTPMILGLRPDPLDVGRDAAEIRPPPPTQQKTASIGLACWRRISMPMVPWPAITSGSSKGCTKLSFSLSRVPERGVGVIVGLAGEHHFAASRLDGLYLDLWRRRRHHDHRPAAEPGRRQRHALGMVAGRGADHAALELFGRKMDDLVVGAAQLEGKHRLQVFALEQHPVADTRRKRRCRIKRGLNRDIVDTRSENSRGCSDAGGPDVASPG